MGLEEQRSASLGRGRSWSRIWSTGAGRLQPTQVEARKIARWWPQATVLWEACAWPRIRCKTWIRRSGEGVIFGVTRLQRSASLGRPALHVRAAPHRVRPLGASYAPGYFWDARALRQIRRATWQAAHW